MLELNGEPVPADQAGPLAVLNYGHFTALLVAGGRVKGLALHLERLVRDCGLVFGTGLDADRVRGFVRAAAERVPADAGSIMLRVTIFESTTSRAQPDVLVTARPAPGRPGASPDGPRLRTVDFTRDLPAVKHVGFFGAIHQRRLAEQAGFDDALFIGRGLLAEGPTWNVAVVLDGELIWPDDNCLPGVTRILLQRVLDDAGIAWSTRSVEAGELPGATAAFITNAGFGVVPVGSIDGVPLPGAPDLLAAMRSGYAAIPADLI
jgi:branched-subunit amino acid aminotransferase/4-amino-4-deoxychorismate lyase